MNEIKRHFYNGVDYELDLENKIVILKPEFHQKLLNKKLWGKFGFKKIGGSSIGDVLEVDQFKSQFVAFCRMAWIAIPILDRKYVDAGIAIEPKVVAAIEKISGKKVETYDPKEYSFDFFANKDDVVGGLPDGYIKEDNRVIEIKTTGEKNIANWEKYGIPQAYHKQTQLYSYLMGSEDYSIVATFLKEEDYLNPEEYPIKKRIVKNWNFKVNKLQAQDDIKKVKEWYYNFKEKGVSPTFDIKRDAQLIEWLKPKNEEEWLTLKNEWIKTGKIK